MRLDTAREDTITNLGGSQKFKMNASAKAFQILSSGIYERKIEAIVRELSCNAYDSHIQAGKPDVPFRIQLPTVMNDSVFAIEDFGVGLTEEEVYNVYTTYFESTKTDSNEVIGALGLGSKTPFSYTDSFTIKARKDGKECVFTAFIGTSGEPEVQKMWERPWTGSNGVEVSVEVSSKDLREFYRCAEKVLSWFEVKPTSNREIIYDISDEVVNNVRQYGYHLEQKSGFGRGVDCKVLMGNVAYDLDLSTLKSENADDVTDQFISQLYNLRADVYFSVEIGDADVAASRETLSLDDQTKQNLRDRLEIIRSTFVETTVKKMDKFDNIIQAYNTLTPYERSLVKDHKVNGWSIRQYDSRRGQVRTTISEAYGDNPDAEAIRIDGIGENYDVAIFGDGFTTRSKPRSKRETSANVNRLIDSSDNKVIVVINDNERKIGLKDALVNNHNLNREVLVVSDKNTTLTKELEDYLNYITFNSFKVIYTSSFWDGKLSNNRSASGGLAEETVKAQIMKRNSRCFSYQKVDLAAEDKGNWAYVKSGDFLFTLKFSNDTSNIMNDTDLRKIMNELDLDGIVAYNANNEKKVKRILPEECSLVTRIEEHASEECYRKYEIFEEMMSEHEPVLMIFEGYEAMYNTLKSYDASKLQCSKAMYERSMNYSERASLSKSIEARKKVFKTQVEILKESSPLLNHVLTNVRFDSNIIPEVRQIIKAKKEA